MANAKIKTRSSSGPQLTLDQAVIAEIAKLRDDGQLELRAEPRCHVCCEVESRELVNKLLAAGLTNREIAAACSHINLRRREAGDEREIEARNVWAHKYNGHFDVDGPAVGVLREIMERRATEANRDHINGVGHAITPYAVLETMMVRGYQGLTANDAPSPSYGETANASVKLHEMTSRDASQRRMADLLHTMDRIINAAQEFIPVEHQEAFVAAVEGKEYKAPMQVLSERTHEVAAKAVKEFHAPRHLDDGDEL